MWIGYLPISTLHAGLQVTFPQRADVPTLHAIGIKYHLSVYHLGKLLLAKYVL